MNAYSYPPSHVTKSTPLYNITFMSTSDGLLRCHSSVTINKIFLHAHRLHCISTRPMLVWHNALTYINIKTALMCIVLSSNMAWNIYEESFTRLLIWLMMTQTDVMAPDVVLSLYDCIIRCHFFLFYMNALSKCLYRWCSRCSLWLCCCSFRLWVSWTLTCGCEGIEKKMWFIRRWWKCLNEAVWVLR